MTTRVLESPYPGDWTVRRALAAYFAENGFSEASYVEAWTPVSFFGLRFAIPNTARHKEALRWHDLHHVATGFGTDLVGEGEISALEVRRGVLKTGLYVAGIIVGVACMGAVLSPLRMAAAFRDAKTVRPLWTLDLRYEDVLEMSVAELRALLRVPPDGVARHARRLHDAAPA
jgi:hypothetical protein